jgi:multicomponent Na+:H+ antiporter subunit D
MNFWFALEHLTLNPTLIIPLALLVPLIGAALLVVCGRYPNVRESITLLTAVILFVLVCLLVKPLMSGQTPTQTWLEIFPGLAIAFKVEPLGLLFALIASFLWIITSIYAIGYMRGHHEINQTRFYFCFALAIASVMGIAFSANLLTLFIFYETLTLSTYPLVTHAGTEEAKKGGRVYLGILLGSSIAMFLFAIIATWSLAGTLDFTPGGILSGKASDGVLGVVLLLFCFGIGKAALMPFHAWLPAAMVAPTPVSALLHAVAVVKAGVFTILKVAIYIFGMDELVSLPMTDIVLYVATATVFLASCIAMTKDNLKARLAYSTVSQLSYIIVAAMLATSAAWIGGSMHIAMHAFGKITLFFCAGAILVASHKKNISELDGLGRIMPFTMLAFLIGSLSIIGLPPAGGTWSKWFLVLGALEADKIFVVVVLMISSLLNIAYLLPIPVRAFFSPASVKETATSGDSAVSIHEAPFACLFAMAITSAACILLFFFPEPLYNLVVLIPGVLP